MTVSRLPKLKIHNEFSDIFTSITCFEGTFKLWMREGSHPYQSLPRRLAHTLQEPLLEELDRLQKQQIIVPLDTDETSKLFHVGPKANGKVRLCLHSAQLNKS